jgi:hypothetical protein
MLCKVISVSTISQKGALFWGKKYSMLLITRFSLKCAFSISFGIGYGIGQKNQLFGVSALVSDLNWNSDFGCVLI